MSSCKQQKKKCVSIGGQAVMEGVMMRGESSMATAVRDADGYIRMETKRIKPLKKRSIFFRLPIIRGVCSFVSSMVSGVSILMRSADVYGEGEPSKFEKWLAKTFKVNVMSVVTTIALLFAVVLAVTLFVFLPQFIRGLLETLFSTKFNLLVRNLIEGLLKIAIFVIYILLCSFMKDVKRTFMYHGAEHKTISCYESGKELTVENTKKCTRVHDRCGTTFIVFVMIISILSFAIFESLVGVELNRLIRIGCKILILPLVAGLAYELLKGLAKTRCFIFYPLKVPGLLLQKVTTREPTDDMIEVAITAFNKVIEMDFDPTISEVKFEMPKSRKQATLDAQQKLLSCGVEEKAEAEWIVSITLGVKRNQVYLDDLIPIAKQKEIDALVDMRCTGRPLWYCIGDTDFYGYTFKVNENVLIPRPETELLVEKALEVIKEGDSVLDLCTGSGAIAVSISKSVNAEVTASDVSTEALDVAKENALINDAKVEFVLSDLFNNLIDKKYNVILSNPPYIKSEDISSLQKEVKDFEPMLALDGGEDGLDFYRQISKQAINHLENQGYLLFERGYNQAEDIKKILIDEGYQSIEIIKDYDNIDRIIKAVR